MNLFLSFSDYAALAPLLILFVGALCLLLVESFFAEKMKHYFPTLTLLFIGIAALAGLVAPISKNPLMTPWLYFDSTARFFTLFFLIIGFTFTLLSIPFLKKIEESKGEYCFLLLSALVGLILIGSAADFLIIFLGIEILAISLYVLCGYMKQWPSSRESAMKYFLMGALATSFLLYGIALIYGALGTTRLNGLMEGYHALAIGPNKFLFLAGMALVILGLAFEAAVVPFQFWAPDVYSGAPMPVTGLMAVGTKVGAFAAFVRVFSTGLPKFASLWKQEIALLAYPTLIYANFVALRQTQLKRFFAYSGISHAGFLLIPVAAGTEDALSSLLFYLVIYAAATSGAFAIMALFLERNEGLYIKDFQGFFRRAPFLAVIFSICLLTLAGIPPTAGFFAKFYIFKVAFEAKLYALVVVGLLTTILSAFYYLRIIATMCRSPSEEELPMMRSRPAEFVGMVSLFLILLLSFYP